MKPLVLCILDGIGISDNEIGNAFKAANTKTFDYLWNRYPHSLLEASGEAVGLPALQMGNSEVGHMNLGAGRIVYQPLEFINKHIADNTFFDNLAFLDVIKHVKTNDSKLHLCGLVSNGGIHSHIDHLFKLIDLAKLEGIKELYIHVFLDGRDTLPRMATYFVDALESKLKEVNLGSIATISGRFYAMDRDNRWDRVELAYNNMTKGTGVVNSDAIDAITKSYALNIDDEFVKPILVNKNGLISDSDGIICFNYRPDRLRELFSALTNPDFNNFASIKLNNLKLVTMMPVSKEVICTNAFKLASLKNTLGEYLSDIGKTQLRIAETEKYAHVTYFFDGGFEKKLKGCDRILVASPLVATYDLAPSMSAYSITDKLLEALKLAKYDIVILNFANGDMVGHTGVFDATVKAIEAVDRCLLCIYNELVLLDGTLVIVADHGNCEIMLDSKGNKITSHSTSKVPFIITDENIKLKDGKLGDVAPTILSIKGIPVPKEMTGNILVGK